MIYEIVNPSDAYTLETNNFMAASIACCLLGSGKYALRDEAGNTVTPFFMFGGLDEWFVEQFGQPFEKCLDVTEPGVLAEVMDSVLIGSISSRAEYQLAIKSMSPDERDAFTLARHDLRRSSMNDIGGRARDFAKQLRENA
jgi:hypothetical protein